MLTPGYANLWAHWYPIGNTPAVCLTQGLPPESKADILLLGCGDVRNILFTVHCDGTRQMDMTCCDIECTIIARNLLLITLILGDPAGQMDSENWDTYYHVFLDQSCHDRLQKQAKKLHALGASLNTWRNSEYGNLIRFCDHGTLSRVANVWAFYISAATEKQSWMKKTFKAAAETQRRALGNNFHNTTGLRSATPTGMLAADELNELSRHFWNHGSLHFNSDTGRQTTHANPMFVSPDATVKLHYGIDPLLGFHIATAYAPLASESPLFREHSKESKMEKVVAAAKAEFSAWSDSFRERSRKGLTLRFFVGDVLPLCYALQHRRAAESSTTGFWYRSRHNTADPLVLVDDDYAPDGTAPVTFNVIDTSNLLDHVAGLNLLTAVSPLLENGASSSLYTETLARQGTDSHQGYFDQLVGGHLPTVSLLLGLFPVEYWTNTSPSSIGDEQVANPSGKSRIGKGQLFARITWKRPPCGSGSSMARLHLVDADLAAILYRVYVDMFPGEQVARMMANMNLDVTQRGSLPSYTRASFAAFLCLIKGRVTTNWDGVMDTLLSRIESSTILATGTNYLQELYLYMHLLNVHSVATFDDFSGFRARMRIELGKESGLANWQDMPSSLCLTLMVPRSALRVFTDSDPEELGTVPVQAVVRDSSGGLAGWINVFATVQLVFGKLSTSGARFSNGFKVNIEDDSQGWHGNSPLHVSFRVPSWMLLLEPQAALVSFALQSTPMTAGRFLKRLGFDLAIFQTNMSDSQHVYISKDLPNQTKTMAVPGFAQDMFIAEDAVESGAKTTISVTTDATTSRIAGLTARLNLFDEGPRFALANGSPVQVTPVSPCAFTVTIGTITLNATFPLPVFTDTHKVRIARKSSYIEIVATVLPNPATWPSATFTCPLLLPSRPSLHTATTPICWTTPYLSLSTLPILSTTSPSAFSFLHTHLAQQFSAREFRLRAATDLASLPTPVTRSERARIGLKESLQCLFSQASGLVSVRNPTTTTTTTISTTNHSDNNNKTERIFALTTPTTNTIHTFLFVSSLRLDLARRTVLLDCAVLTLTCATKRALEGAGFFAALGSAPGSAGGRRGGRGERGGGGIVHIKADADEMELWRAVLPAWVERCREWAHKADACEYYRTSAAAAAAAAAGGGVFRTPEAEGEEAVCGCGKGVFPDGWDGGVGVPMWEMVKGFCVRAAIAPLFASALAEEMLPELGELVAGMRRLGEESGGGDGVMECRSCGRSKTDDGGDLKACSKCLGVRYCSRACQRVDWKRHKKDCGANQ